MKFKAISYLAVGAMAVLTACSHEGDNFGDRVLFTGTETSPVVKFLCDGMSSTALTVTSTAKATTDVHITVKAAPELLDAYNKKYNRSFVAPEPNMYQLENTDLVIKAGSNMSSQVKITSNSEDLAEGVGYMLPITITSVSGDDLGVIEDSRTAYVQFTKVITIKAGFLNGSSSYEIPGFKCTDASDPLSSPVAALNQMTIEMKVLPLRFGTNPNQASGISTLCGNEENFLFRFGDGGGQPTNQLELVKGAIGTDPSPDKRSTMPTPISTWVHSTQVTGFTSRLCTTAACFVYTAIASRLQPSRPPAVRLTFLPPTMVRRAGLTPSQSVLPATAVSSMAMSANVAYGMCPALSPNWKTVSAMSTRLPKALSPAGVLTARPMPTVQSATLPDMVMMRPCLQVALPGLMARSVLIDIDAGFSA